MKRFAIGCFILGWMGLANAQVALGPVYPIAEPDLLALVKQHARDEATNVIQRSRETRDGLKRYAETPTGGPNLPTARVDREWSFISPTTNDQIIPTTFERQWLFINGNDKEQVTLAKRFMAGKTVATHRVILTAGSVKTVAESLETRVWFDQASVLTKRFQIQAVPCLLKATKQTIYLKEIGL